MQRRSVWLFLLLSYWGSGYCDSQNGDKPIWNATWTDKLKRDLLQNYDKFARPSQHFNVTQVNLELVLKHIDLTWTDEKLRWNTTSYGDLDVLHLADHEVWEPDVVLYNSAVGNNIDHYGNTHCLAHPDGTILWVPPAQFQVFCSMDLSKWPFDEHTCILRLGSWTYSGYLIDLRTNDSEPIEVDLTVSEWDVIKATKQRQVQHYPCCEEPYIDIRFDLTLKRKSPTYSSTFINAAIALVILTLSVFWLPPDSGEKFLACGTAITFTSIYLVYFSYRLPNMGANTPLVVAFFSNSLLFVAISMVISVIAFNLCRSKNSCELPWFIVSILRGPLGRLIWLPSTKNREDRRIVTEEMTERHFDDEGTHEEKTMLPTSGSRDWINLAIAIDRISFIIYLIVFIVYGLKFIFY